MRDTITNIIVQSIIEVGMNDPTGDTLVIPVGDLRRIADYATGEILDAVDARAQEQWDGEYALAHL